MSGSNEGGYEERFIIERKDGKPIPSDRRYMVLSFDGSDPEAVEALRFYAFLCATKKGNLQLSKEVIMNTMNPSEAPKQHRY